MASRTSELLIGCSAEQFNKFDGSIRRRVALTHLWALHIGVRWTTLFTRCGSGKLVTKGGNRLISGSQALTTNIASYSGDLRSRRTV